MDDDENNEEFEQTDDDTDNDQDKSAKRQLEKLNEYVQQMAYKPIEHKQASKRTEELAKAPKKYILGTYAEHKNNLKPKERSDRIGKIVQNHTPMTIENLEEWIRKHRKKQAELEKVEKKQQIKYHETLLKLQNQCEKQLMNAIVQNFAKTISKKASCIISQSNVETESYQCLKNSLLCKIIFDLKVPNEKQTKDLTVYKKLAGVLADLILQALFLSHNSEEHFCADGQESQLPKPNEMDLVIKLRALRAAKKKLYQSSEKFKRLCSFISSFE